ncbi:MAG: sigma-70 family RNA polymerase sigma factor [Rhodocyclaceae bacterium]|nr:sigma-70 family RNA polymerase sigma factor [Rhodocyclaceae bacterium]
MQTESRAKQIVRMLDNWPLADTATPMQPQRFGRRARQVLIMRYLHDMTLEQVGQALGITRERVRQIEGKALRMIRSKPELMRKIRDMLNEIDAQ